MQEQVPSTSNNIIQHSSDKELILLNEIDEDTQISQRELALKTGLSLGSVNLLLRKMIKQGLIKMETIPANRIIYMLTPAGLAEKTFKTVRYIKVHYKVIEETKRSLLRGFDKLLAKYGAVYILQPEDELKELLEQTLAEYLQEYVGAPIHLISDATKIDYELISELAGDTDTEVLSRSNADEEIASSETSGKAKTAILALPDNLLLEQVQQEYRQYLVPVSLLDYLS